MPKCKESASGGAESTLPVVGHREGNLKLGQELEVLLLVLLSKTCSYKQLLNPDPNNQHSRENLIKTRFKLYVCLLKTK